jgi:hypothetical protein
LDGDPSARQLVPVEVVVAKVQIAADGVVDKCQEPSAVVVRAPIVKLEKQGYAVGPHAM